MKFFTDCAALFNDLLNLLLVTQPFGTVLILMLISSVWWLCWHWRDVIRSPVPAQRKK